MLSEFSDQLTQVTEKRRLKHKIEQDLFQVDRSLKERSSLLATLEQEFRQEQVDVEKLERLSLAGLFYAVLGSREEQVEKERQEMLAAQLKYQQAKHEVEALRADLDRLNKQLNELHGIDDESTAILSKKESLLRQSDPQIAGELIRLSEGIANRNAEIKEIDEAILAATGVLASLNQVIESLESAEGWGTWDMLGGGLLTTAIKHSRIDDARGAVHEVQARMSRFTRELADVQRDTDLKIDVGDLDIFADYFFDGLIVDWIVQSKIRDSLQQASMTRERITKAVKGLEKLKSDVQAQARRLSEQRVTIIEQS